VKILIPVILVIVGYLLFKKFFSNSGSATTAASPTQPEQLSADSNSASGQASGSIASDQTSSSPAQSTDGSAGDTANSAISSQAASTSSAAPSTGNRVTDIQELFKILNLRASDSPRLGITSDQYNDLKNGQIGQLSDEVLNGVMGKLKAML